MGINRSINGDDGTINIDVLRPYFDGECNIKNEDNLYTKYKYDESTQILYVNCSNGLEFWYNYHDNGSEITFKDHKNNRLPVICKGVMRDFLEFMMNDLLTFMKLEPSENVVNI